VNRGERRVLDELSFEAESGEIVGLLGPNGAGKTTTLAVLSTLLRPSAGEVRIAGHDLRTDVEGVRRSVGRVPQEVAVYPRLSGRENAIFFARLAGVRAADARRAAAERDKGYRGQALKLYPWICGRCAREFTHATLQLLEVHHRDGNHDNNPPDGSNWELLCIYCHDNEHARDQVAEWYAGEAPEQAERAPVLDSPFAKLGDLLKEKK